jgi:uncharacterized protein YabN with tetrapyrrole methylase and pyrophosphatase domain
MKTGSLTIVGTGFLVPGQTTPEARACIMAADKLLHLSSDPVAQRWIESLHPAAESLHDAYAEGKPRERSYEEMVERMLEPVRQGLRVCVALYGHPGVFVLPSHVAIARAREEGFRAVMLPGISAEDCLFADLELDPASYGCQSFEATYFLEHGVRFDQRAALILWQVGAIGISTYMDREIWSQEGTRRLAEALLASYPADHQVVLYETSFFAICPPRIRKLPLELLAEEPVSPVMTLLVPPLGSAATDPTALARLGLSLDLPDEEPSLPAASDRKGSLIVVGTGYQVAGQVTPEARACLKKADRVFYLTNEPVTAAWIASCHPNAQPLEDCNREGEPGIVGARRMVEMILEAVRRGERVCAAFYGHPAIYMYTPQTALWRARAEGHTAKMLPAISCEDCLIADLGVDPGTQGRLLFEATDFVIRPRTLETRAPLILLQPGLVGASHYQPAGGAVQRERLRVLTDRLLRDYPATHPVVLYHMSQLPLAGPTIDRLPLADLPEAAIHPMTTLYVPPL